MLLQEVHIRRYLWNVYRELPGNRKQKEAILYRVEDSVRAYATENPRLNYTAIVARFGEPRAVAESYISEMTLEKLLDDLQLNRKIKRIIVCVAAVGIVVWIAAVGAALGNEISQADGYYEITVSVD